MLCTDYYVRECTWSIRLHLCGDICTKTPTILPLYLHYQLIWCK